MGRCDDSTKERTIVEQDILPELFSALPCIIARRVLRPIQVPIRANEAVLVKKMCISLRQETLQPGPREAGRRHARASLSWVHTLLDLMRR